MLNPSQARVVDPILTTHVQGYRNAQFVGSVLFPQVPVDQDAGKVIEFGKEAFVLYNARRAAGANTKRIDFGYQGKPYALFQDSLEGKVPVELMRAAQVPGIDMGQRATNTVMRSLMLLLENEQAQTARNAAAYDNNHKLTLSGTDLWWDPASKPSVTIRLAKEAIRSSIGVYPNVALLGPTAFSACQENPALQDRFKYTSSDSITTDMLARMWELDQVQVGQAVSADPNNGAFTDVWGDDIILAYVPAAASGNEEPSYGYTYTLRGNPLVEQSYYDNNAKSWIYPVTYNRGPQLTGMTAGFLIKDAGKKVA